VSATSNWDYGDYLLSTTVAHYAPNGGSEDLPSAIVTSVTNFTVPQVLPVAVDSVVFGYLGPTGAMTVNNSGALFTLADAYTANLGSQTYAETIAGFFGKPADSSVTLSLNGTSVSSQDTRLEGQQIIVQGSGRLQSNGALYVAGNVSVTGNASILGQTVIVDNDYAYLSQTSDQYSGPPTYGAAAPKTTTLTLNGSNAILGAATLIVGDQSTNGPATLQLQNGAKVTIVNLFTGVAAKSEGDITVDKSSITATSFLDIGVSGKSTLTIQDGGTFTVTGAGSNVGLANHTGSTATVLVTDPGSSVMTSASIFVGGNGMNGDGGTATMTVTNFATVTTGDALGVGNSGGGTDSLTISGGAGVSSSVASGSASDFSGIVGSRIFTGTATATITGAASEWVNKQSISIGASGTGTVMVTNGGTLEVDGSTVEIGHDSGGTGTLTFDKAGGANPTFTFNGPATNQLIVGDQGTGNFNVPGGAQITIGASVIIGNQGSTGSGPGTGSATVKDPNSSWTIGGNLTVGEGGNGTLMIMNGDTVSVGGTAILGDKNGSNGTLTLDGAGSKLTFTTMGNTLMIGNLGTGTLQVQNGASASLTDTVLGAQSQGTGKIIVSGSTSGGSATGTVTLVGMLTVGGSSPGTSVPTGNSLGPATEAVPGGLVSVTGGGTMTVSGTVVIGQNANSTGEVDVDGKSSTFTINGTNQPSLTVGQAGMGTFNLTGGAQFTVSSISMAVVSGSGMASAPDKFSIVGTGVQSGGQTTMTVNGPFIVGVAGTAEVDLSAGAQITTFGAVTLGQQGSGNGTVMLQGSGTKWDASSGGTFTVGQDNTGTLNVQAGATLNAFNLTLGGGTGASGSVTVTGLNSSIATSVLNAGGAHSAKTQLTVNQGASVTTGSLVINGGAPTITVDGSDQQSGTASKLTTGSLSVSPQADSALIKVTNGGQFIVTGGAISIPGGSGGSNSLAIRGTNSQFIAASSELDLGDGSSNTAALTVVSGGVLTTASTVISGSNTTATIGMQFTNPATWNISGFASLFNGATMTINPNWNSLRGGRYCGLQRVHAHSCGAATRSCRRHADNPNAQHL
jgi:fibronectin-binding autotransporter adhesin